MEQTKIQEILKDFVEKGAAIEHERWSKWQKYMHSKILPTEHDALMQIGTEFVERWNRQIDTPYAELSEKEKESDRVEARTYLPLIEEIITSALQQGKKEGKREAIEEVYKAVNDTLWNKDGSLKWHDISDIVSRTMHTIMGLKASLEDNQK